LLNAGWLCLLLLACSTPARHAIGVQPIPVAYCDVAGRLKSLGYLDTSPRTAGAEDYRRALHSFQHDIGQPPTETVTTDSVGWQKLAQVDISARDLVNCRPADGPPISEPPPAASSLPSAPGPQPAALPFTVPRRPPPVRLEVGSPAFAIESIQCEGTSGTWVLLVKGPIREIGGDAVTVSAESRFGLHYWPKEQGKDETDWFCVPRRRFCWSKVSFSDWGGKLKQDDLLSLSADRIFPERLGIPAGTQPIIERQCQS